MTDEAAEPLFTHDEPGPRFKAKDIVNILARGGVPFGTASARVANYAKAGQIHVRAKAGNGKANSASLYALSDVAAAVMLSCIQDCGVADQEFLSLASATLYGWNLGQTARSTHPILAAAFDTWNDSPWVLQFDFFRHVDGENREVNRAFYRLGDVPVWSSQRYASEPGWMPIGTLLINTSALLPLSRLLDTAAN